MKHTLSFEDNFSDIPQIYDDKPEDVSDVSDCETGIFLVFVWTRNKVLGLFSLLLLFI